MTAYEVLDKSKGFAEELVSQLSDKSVDLNKRQVYFMDNHSKVQACMSSLKTIVESYQETPDSLTDDDLKMMNDAKAVLSTLQNTIADFQKELMIVETVNEDDIKEPQGLTQETLKGAMQNNETTKKIAQDMETIAKNAQGIPYNHCMVCDGKLHMFAAATKEELEKAINDIANAGSYKDIRLYKMSFSPVSMKKKTVLTV